MYYEDQFERAFGVVTDCQDNATFLDIYLGDEEGEYPCEAPNGLAYIPTDELGEVACLREYNRGSDRDGWVCFRIVDERVRGWSDDELEDLIFGGGDDPLILISDD